MTSNDLYVVRVCAGSACYSKEVRKGELDMTIEDFLKKEYQEINKYPQIGNYVSRILRKESSGYSLIVGNTEVPINEINKVRLSDYLRNTNQLDIVIHTPSKGGLYVF